MINRISNLTGVRFYLATWVILFHTDRFNIPFLQKGYLAVDCFFILSGFILTHVYRKKLFDNLITWSAFLLYLRKRFFRLYPVHLATLISAFIIIHFLHFLVSRDYYQLNYFSLLSHLFMVHAWNIPDHLNWNVFSWSISVEWFAYIFVFPILALFIFYSGWKKMIPIVLILFIAFLFYINANDERLDFRNIYRIIPEFIIGSFFYFFYYNNVKNWRCISFYLYFLILPLALVSVYYSVSLDYTIIPYFLILLGFLLNDNRSGVFLFSNRWILLGGEISYSMYMVQVIPMLILKVGFQILHKKLGVDDRTLNAFLPFIVLPICIGLGYLSFIYIEKPIEQRFGNKVNHR